MPEKNEKVRNSSSPAELVGASNLIQNFALD